MGVRAGANIWLAGGTALDSPELSTDLSITGSISADATSELPSFTAYSGDVLGARSQSEHPTLHAIELGEARVVGVLLPGFFGSSSGESGTISNPPTPPGPSDPGPASVTADLPSLYGVAAANEPIPDVSLSMGTIPSIRGGFIYGAPWWTGEVDERPLPVIECYAGDLANNAARSGEDLPALTGEAIARGDFAMLIADIGGLVGGLSDDELRVVESLTATIEARGTVALVVKEVLRVQSTHSTTFLADVRVTEEMVLRAIAGIPYNLHIVEALLATDITDSVVERIAAVTEHLLSADSIDSQAELLLSIALALSIAESVGAPYLVELTEVLNALDLNVANITVAVETVEALLGTDTVGNNVTFTALAAESVTVTDIGSSTASLRIAIEEGLGLFVNIKVGDDVFQGWVLNTATSGFSQYDNFPFNSFARVRGETFAAGEDGLFKLGGSTDDGAEIAAHVKTGLLDMGSHFMKDVKAAHVGFTSDNRMVLKVTVMNHGVKEEHWYEMIPTSSGSPRDGRVTVQRGLRSRYWQFELANADGGDFAVDDIDVMFNVLSRRLR